jgi:hypothetical protein
LDLKLKLLPTGNHKLGLLGAFVAYPIGKVLLRILTLGHYPPEDRPHNALLVAMTPWWVFGIVITVVYG